MRYVSIALSVEGPTDKAFLWPIVYRTAFSLATDAVIQESPHFIDCEDNDTRAQEICSRSKDFDVFAIHADATRAAKSRITETIIGAIRNKVVSRSDINENRVVGLGTVSEMESWALCSPQAIAESLGFQTWPDRCQISWTPSETETLPDPKRTLSEALEGLLRRPLSHVLHYETLEALGENVPLAELALLPSYRQFRDDMRACLTALGAAR